MFLWRKKDIFEGREKTRFFVARDKSRLRFFSAGMFRPWKTKAQVIFSGRFVCARARVRERVREGMREGLRKWESGKGGGKKRHTRIGFFGPSPILYSSIYGLVEDMCSIFKPFPLCFFTPSVCVGLFIDWVGLLEGGVRNLTTSSSVLSR